MQKAKPPEPTPAQVGDISSQAMQDLQPSQEKLNVGATNEIMCSVMKLFAKQILETQALKMPPAHVPAEV